MRAPCVNSLQIFLFTTHITCRSIAVSFLPFPTLHKSAINFIANHFLAAFLGHFVNMMFSLVAPLLLLSALLMRLFAVIADENIFNLLYAIERGGRQTEKGQSDAYFLLTQRAALGHASHGVVKWQLPSSTPTCVSVWCVGVAARNKTVCVMNLLLNCVAYDNNYNSSSNNDTTTTVITATTITLPTKTNTNSFVAVVNFNVWASLPASLSL